MDPEYETIYTLQGPTWTRKCCMASNGETAEGPHVVRVLAAGPSESEDRTEATFDGSKFTPFTA